jgi:NADPH-dependent 2,4-dienoyl-CoA reductase/sulfur reductase-like enzyme
VVIVGAGFIAFTILDAVARHAARVRFVELAPQILPHMLDPQAAELLEAHLAERGIEVHKGTSPARIESSGGRRRLELASGETIECDRVVLATGIRPNLEFLEGSGIDTDHGILVDDHLRTSRDHVYAAGDVAQGPDLLSDRCRVQAIQPTAVDHGRVAGANMAGLDVVYSGSLTMNILAAQDLEACSFGLWEEDAREVTRIENPGNRIYRKYVWDGDRLVGGILVGPALAVSGTNDVGMLKGLIQTGVRLGPWKEYLVQNPMDLRRPYVASGAARELMNSTLLAGRASVGGGYRLPAAAAPRVRSPHHATLLSGTPPK